MERLKLIALDEQDLQVIAAHCQDAVLKAFEIEYLPREKRLVLAMNRFVWEAAVEKRRDFERRRTVLHFERVLSVRSRGVSRTDKDQILSLLTISFVASEQPSGTIELVFSAGASMQIDVECIEAQMADMAAAWGTASRPDHSL